MGYLEKYYCLGVLEELSDYEKEEYAKNPSGLNATIIPVLYQEKLKDAISFKVKNQNDNYEIYLYSDPVEGLVILKTAGSISELSKKEQLKKVLEDYKGLLNAKEGEIRVDVKVEPDKKALEQREKIIKMLKKHRELLSDAQEERENDNTLKLKK